MPVRDNRLGLIAYLFVMGEVVDAYQSRTISHLERVKMLLRCRYFLRLWKQFLGAAGYTQSRYYISREADDILDTLVDSLLALIYVYHDHPIDQHYPLLPWLHSTEMCEHTFAECRKLVKDFLRVELGEGGNLRECQESIRRSDASVILDTLKMSARAEKSRAANNVQNTPRLLLTTTQSDLSQLVTTRRTHQTKRAANSVKTHASPQDSISPQPAE